MPAPAVAAVRHRLTGRPANHRESDAGRSSRSLHRHSAGAAVACIANRRRGRGLRPARQRATKPARQAASYRERRMGRCSDRLIERDGAGYGLMPAAGIMSSTVDRLPSELDDRQALAVAGPDRRTDRTKGRPMGSNRGRGRTDHTVLPLGFVTCIIDAGKPASACSTSTPHCRLVGRSDASRQRGADGRGLASRGSRASRQSTFRTKSLPAYLSCAGRPRRPRQATWTANVDDRWRYRRPLSCQLPVSVLLAALASTRPLPAALEHELRRADEWEERLTVDLDPLRRFDDSSLLLQRTRHFACVVAPPGSTRSSGREPRRSPLAACTAHSGPSLSLTDWWPQRGRPDPSW